MLESYLLNKYEAVYLGIDIPSYQHLMLFQNIKIISSEVTHIGTYSILYLTII